MTRNKYNQLDARSFRQLEGPELIERLDRLRHFLCTSRTPLRSPEFRAVQEIIERIDNLAELLTGDREHFWDRAQGDAPRRPS